MVIITRAVIRRLHWWIGASVIPASLRNEALLAELPDAHGCMRLGSGICLIRETKGGESGWDRQQNIQSSAPDVLVAT